MAGEAAFVIGVVALSHRPFLLVSTYLLPGVGFNKVNGLVNEPRAATKPLLARCDNTVSGATATVQSGSF